MGKELNTYIAILLTWEKNINGTGWKQRPHCKFPHVIFSCKLKSKNKLCSTIYQTLLCFDANTFIFYIKHEPDYALLLSRLKGKGKFTRLHKRSWANSFGPGNTLEAKQRKDTLYLGLQPSINLIIGKSWILSSNVRYAPKICSMKQSCVRHIHLNVSRTKYWKNHAGIQVIMWSCPAPTLLFYTLSLYILVYSPSMLF